MRNYSLATFVLFILCSCSNLSNDTTPVYEAQTLANTQIKEIIEPASESVNEASTSSNLNPQGKTIETRFSPPSGFKRTKERSGSYANYLRKLPLKKHGAQVKYYNGGTKNNNAVYDGVVDLKIGNKDLHQCADAIMRLRAEYLWENKDYDDIHFNFTNGFRVDYSKWMKGNRVLVDGNKTSWAKRASASNSYRDFWNYMEMIFMYAGTLSLSKELESISMDEIQIGDIFIQGGSPGHAITVVDMVENSKNKERCFLLAQSYMPAQEIQILKNPSDPTKSPWYSADFGQTLETPEWTFRQSDLKRFEE